MRTGTLRFAVLTLAPLLMAQSRLVALPQTEELEQEFSQAQDLEIVRSIADMPANVHHILSTYVSPWPIAELEEYASLADIKPDRSVPDKQHIYSAISDRLSVVLLHTGTTAGPPISLLLLYDRRSMCGAIYALGKLSSIPPLKRLQNSIGQMGRYRTPTYHRQFCLTSPETE